MNHRIRLAALLIVAVVACLSSTPAHAADCDGMVDYVEAMNTARLRWREQWEESDNLPDLETLAESDVELDELFLSLSPEQLTEMSDLFGAMASDLNDIEPPDVAADYHETLTLMMQRINNFLRDASTIGVVDAALIYDSTPTAEDPDADGLEFLLAQQCEEFAELKNVHDVLANADLEVEYGRESARVDGLSPVGQQLIVEGQSSFVFLFPGPVERQAEMEGLDADSIMLVDTFGEQVTNEPLSVFEGSNVVVILVGGDVDLTDTIRAAISGKS